MKALYGSDENCILEKQKYYLMRLCHLNLSFWRRTATAPALMWGTSDRRVCSTIPSQLVLSPKSRKIITSHHTYVCTSLTFLGLVLSFTQTSLGTLIQFGCCTSLKVFFVTRGLRGMSLH